MTTFATPEPVSATIELGAGDITITASDRSDTVVTVSPRDPGKSVDVQAAAETVVECDHGLLSVRFQRPWRRFTGPGKNHGSVIVAVDVPSGSSVDATTGFGFVHTEGELAATTAKSGMGDLRLDRVGQLRAKTGFGDVTVDRVDGDLTVSTGTGTIRLGSVAGSGSVKNSTGPVEVVECAQLLRIRTAGGAIRIGRALASLDVVSAAGDIQLGEVSGGSVSARTGAGAISVGVRPGAAAWLEVSSRYGSVRNALTESAGPDGSDTTVEVVARTGAGDITISRASAA